MSTSTGEAPPITTLPAPARKATARLRDALEQLGEVAYRTRGVVDGEILAGHDLEAIQDVLALVARRLPEYQAEAGAPLPTAHGGGTEYGTPTCIVRLRAGDLVRQRGDAGWLAVRKVRDLGESGARMEIWVAGQAGPWIADGYDRVVLRLEPEAQSRSEIADAVLATPVPYVVLGGLPVETVDAEERREARLDHEGAA